MRAQREVAAGVVLGLGLGGFVDGIVAHQLLGWHHLLSGWYPGQEHLRLNLVGDGLFHLLCLLLVLIGIGLLSQVPPGPGLGRRLTGWLLSGWGWFNLVEGLVNHQLLGVHHVRPGPGELAFDLGFLALGLLLVAGGWLLARTRRA